MKKAISLILTLTLLCALCACGAEKPAESASTPAPTSAPAPAPAETPAAPAETPEAPEEDGQNPVMNFIGPYSAGRPSLLVEAEGKSGAVVTVRWGSSAWESSEWVMHGEFDPDTLTVEYRGGVRIDSVFSQDGKTETRTKQYEDGTGRFVFREDGELSVTWEDDKEHLGDGLTFTWSFVPEDVVDYIDPGAFVGNWVCGRALLEIAPDGEDSYKCFIRWGSSAFETSTWEYDCYCDGDKLVSFETGVRYDLTFAGDGSIAERKRVFDDGAAAFEMLENGKVVWTDYKAYPDGGVNEFERTELAFDTPLHEALAEDYFRAVGSFHPGTSGGTLAKANAAAQAFACAASRRFWSVYADTIRFELQAAWEGLNDDERSAFKENLAAVEEMIDAAKDDWAGVKGAFEDAGAAADMQSLLLDPTNYISWSILCEQTRATEGIGA